MAGTGAPGELVLHDRATSDEDEDVGTLRDLLPGFLDELGDYELLTGALGEHPAVGVPTDAAVAREVPPLQPQTTTSNKDSEAKRPPMQNSTRRRQKQELEYLRVKVEELEQELTGLKKQLMRGRSDGADGTSAATKEEGGQKKGGGEELALPKVSGWERIAKHQLMEKQKAEMKNLKLREMLESQIKVARSLEKVLKKRPNAMVSHVITRLLPLLDIRSTRTVLQDSLDVLEADTADSWSKRLRSFDSNEDSLYESLLSKTDAVYAELDSVCARHRSMQLDEEMNDSHVHLSNRNQLYMEVTSSKIVPFGLQATSRAVWRCLSLNRVKLADGAYYRVDSTSDSVAAKAVMKLRISDSLALMRMRFVMKKFEEDDRIVLACVSASESEGPRDVLHGLRMMERVWVVIRPVNGPEGGGPSTIVQLCMRMTPSISSDNSDPDRLDQQQDEHTGTLTDLILSALHRNLGWLFQTVENILMEEVVALP